MKKAVLSNKIFINFEESLYENVKENLTYKIPAKMLGDPPVIVNNYQVIGNKIITLPIGRMDLIPSDYEIVDKRALNPVDFPKFKFTLRDDQQVVYDRVHDNCLVNANTSWGKTFCGIAIASKLGQKTLVITHTVNLRDQWVEEVKKTLGIEPGIIGGVDKKPVLRHKDKCITIANVQTLRKHIQELKHEFGTVILDECHHCPASIFTACIDGLAARYKIGLSATLQRKDFLHILIPDFFSRKIYSPPPKNQMKPEVYILQTDIPLNSNPMIPWANKINELTERPEYLDLVTSIAERFADLGHSVLVVSDRTEFLKKCVEKSGDRAAMIIGNTVNRDKLHEELKGKERDILYGSISIYKEGISESYLSCLVLGTPVNNDPLLEQLIGRILRLLEGKLTPVIVDIVLTGSTSKKQARSRAMLYMRNGYKVTHIDLR